MEFYQIYVLNCFLGVLMLKELIIFCCFLLVLLFDLLKDVLVVDEVCVMQFVVEVVVDFDVDFLLLLVQGDVFIGNLNGVFIFCVVQCEVQECEVSCVVELIFSDVKLQLFVKWIDKVMLVCDVCGWVIDNIQYVGGNVFMCSGMLQDVMCKVFKCDVVFMVLLVFVVVLVLVK